MTRSATKQNWILAAVSSQGLTGSETFVRRQVSTTTLVRTVGKKVQTLEPPWHRPLALRVGSSTRVGTPNPRGPGGRRKGPPQGGERAPQGGEPPHQSRAPRRHSGRKARRPEPPGRTPTRQGRTATHLPSEGAPQATPTRERTEGEGRTTKKKRQSKNTLDTASNVVSAQTPSEPQPLSAIMKHLTSLCL